MPAIRLDHVAKIYKDTKRGVSQTLLLDLTIPQGDFIFFTGEQGSGKSTLMKLLAGELEPDHGSIWLGGANLSRMPHVESMDARECMGIVMQEPELRRRENIFKNLASPGHLEYLSDRIFNRRKIEKALALVGLSGKSEYYVEKLSESDCRRVEVARAIWRSPSILLIDGLLERVDDDTAWDMLHLFGALNDRGTTVVVATSGSYGSILGKRVVNLREGQIASGTDRGSVL